jgi:hypothetical protein
MTRPHLPLPGAAAGLALILVALLNGCTGLQVGTHEFPAFDQENAALIDKALSDLKIADLISPVVKKTEKSVVVSMEDTVSRSNSSFNYLVDDNLIANLVSGGFRVLERDENLIVREIPEGSDLYTRSLLRLLPTAPSVVLMDEIQKNGLSSLLQDKKLSFTDIIAFYKQINDDYKALFAAQNRMEAADVIISYRLIELGIRADMNKMQVEKVWTWQIRREALARLFIRVMDAKTGEIRTANILQSQLANTVSVPQYSYEIDSVFDARADNYLASLSKYHYSWYEQQMPNKNGNVESQSREQIPHSMTSPPASSQTLSRPIKLSAGVLVSVAPLEYNNQTASVSGANTSVDMYHVSVGGKAFFDFAYGEVSLGYGASVGKMFMSASSGVTTSEYTKFSVSSLDIQLVGKYPFSFGSFALFPLAGLEKYFCLGGSMNGVAFANDDISDYSPWFVLAGVGADITLSRQLFIRTELTGAYNLTSRRSPSSYAGTTYVSSSGWEIKLAAGIGYSFN